MTPKVTPEFGKFLLRTGMSKADLLRNLGLDPKSSLIAAYASGRATPSYDMCVRLLHHGMTIEELFGPEIWEQAKTQALIEKGCVESLTDEQCRRIVQVGLAALHRGENQSNKNPLG